MFEIEFNLFVNTSFEYIYFMKINDDKPINTSYIRYSNDTKLTIAKFTITVLFCIHPI